MSINETSNEHVMQVDYGNQEDPFVEETTTEEEDGETTEEKPTEQAEVKTEEPKEEPKPKEEEKPTDDKPVEEKQEAKVDEKEEKKPDEVEPKEDDKKDDEKKEEKKEETKDELPKEVTSIIETIKPSLGDDVELKTVEDVNKAVKDIVESNKDLKTKNTAYIQDNEKIRVMFQKNPDIASMLESLASGDSPLYAMGFIKDIIDNATEDEVAEYERGNKARNEKLKAEREAISKYEALSAQMEESNKEFDKNLKESDKAVRAWAKENGVTDEQADKEIKMANELFSEHIFKGKIDSSVMDIIHLYVNKDTLLNDAIEAGRIKAKNEKIVEKKLDIKGKTDGLPDNSVSDNALNAKTETEQQRIQRILGYVPKY